MFLPLDQRYTVFGSRCRMLEIIEINGNNDTKKFNRKPSLEQIVWSRTFYDENTEAATGGVLLKKVFLKISHNSQENICVRVSFLIKLQDSGTGVFLWILQKFLRAPFLQNT